MFEALFKGVSTLFGLLTIEKSVENPDFIFVHPSKIFVWGAYNYTIKKTHLDSVASQKSHFQPSIESLSPRSEWARYGEQKIAQFRTHDLTKELACVSTQQSGQFDTFLFNHFSVH
jgi:hypothetical protein